MRDYFFRAAVQLRTAVIGGFRTEAAVWPSTRGMTNCVPSRDTAKTLVKAASWPRMPAMKPDSNKGRGSEDCRVEPLVRISAANTLLKLHVSMKKSSLPSGRQRGPTPPFLEICHLPSPGGNDCT